MTTQLRHTFGLGLLILASAAQAATVPIDLYAKSGTTNLPTGSVPPTSLVIGFVLAPDTTLTAPGGPVLSVNQGDVVTVTLHNNWSEATSLHFQGQAMVPDQVGAAPGATATYVFTASNPGTFLYEAGPLANAQHQAAMGLYGALVVRPATSGQAYADPSTAFNDEAVLVLSELDPALNSSATPATFDMRNYAPKYFLINGKPYPNTDLIPTAAGTSAGNRVLLRYVNAGVQHHSMTLLGTQQTVVAKDGSPFQYAGNRVAETIAPGQTMDAIVTVPASTVVGSKLALFDGSLNLFNNKAAGFGGMLTFLSVTSGPGGGAGGPAVASVSALPSPTNGSVAVTVSASIPGATSAEFFVDAPAGTSHAMAGSGSFTGTLAIGDLAALGSGSHTIYVHGSSNGGTSWGPFNSAVLNLDKAGPVTSGLTLTPNPSNGTVSVALHATGDDSAKGGSNVVAAEYFVGSVGANGTGGSMIVNVAAPVASLDATIAPPVTGGIVSVHSRDALGNWGAFATIALNVVTSGPVTSNVSAAKNPNNGAVPLNSSNPVVRVTATMASAGSTVGGAEGFIDCNPSALPPPGPCPSGTGFPFIASDGTWNSATETGFADIPLTTINALSAGNHTIYVHGKDTAGNWGATGTVILVIDKTAPAISSVTLTPSTMVFGTAGTVLNVSATDVGTGVAGGQYWLDGTATPPANATSFTGTASTINTSALAGGVHVVYVRVQDAASNWSAVSSASLTVIRAVNDSRTISATNSATQTSDATSPGVLANDLPIGLAGRTAVLASAPVRTGGTGAGTIAVTCPAALGTAATPAVGGNTVCTNGAYRVTLNGVGGTGSARQASKRGSYQFTYREVVNGVTSLATVTITVN